MSAGKRPRSKLGRGEYMGWFFVAPFLLGIAFIFSKVLVLSIRFQPWGHDPDRGWLHVGVEQLRQFNYDMLFVNALTFSKHWSPRCWKPLLRSP